MLWSPRWRHELAEARGAARAVLAAAESARGEAQHRRLLVQNAYAGCLDQLTEARDNARLDIQRRYRYESTRLAGNVRHLAALTASGAASLPWRMWTPTEPTEGRGPGLLRIGTLTVDEVTTLPGLVPLLDVAHLSLAGAPAAVDQVITGLLLRALGSTRPGDIQLTVYDPERVGSLAPFTPLGITQVGLDGFGSLLDSLAEHISRINETVLAGEYRNLADLARNTPGPRPEPWRIVVLLADRATAARLTPAQHLQLARVVRTGVACGVHLLVRGLDLQGHPTVRRLSVGERTAIGDLTGNLEVRLDQPPPADQVAAFCRDAAERLRTGPPPARLAELIPDQIWTGSASVELAAVIGHGKDGTAIEVALHDESPHALIGGPPGLARTNLVYAWLAGLANRYGPAELALYLLDFRPGVSFARFVPSARDPSWLPQVRLAGINIAADREFGLAVLRHLTEELRTRAQAAKRHETSNLAQLRDADPDCHWPRIVALLDEFPVLLADGEALTLFADLARRGPAHGIHLILSGPDGPARQVLAQRPDLSAEFKLRIALPKASRVLADGNLAATVIAGNHVVVNAQSGAGGANLIVQLPDAGDRSAWRIMQHRLWRERPDGCEPPRLFDGAAVPQLPESCRPNSTSGPGPATASSPGAVLGERIDVTARPARLRLGRMPGRNLAVLGTRTAEACDVLAAAALSLAEQTPAHFSIVCQDPEAASAAGHLVAELPSAQWFADLAEVPLLDVPHYVLGYALNTVDPALLRLLSDGPERRTHVLGWWRSVADLRAGLGGDAADFDTIGAWVALDVPGADLAPLHPQPGGPAWQPRARRALFFDRSVHRTPEMIIPYEVSSEHT